MYANKQACFSDSRIQTLSRKDLCTMQEPISASLSALCPQSWRIAHLSYLGPDDWQVAISDEEWVILGTGETIEVAIAIAAERTCDERYYRRRLISAPRAVETVGRNLLQALGLTKPRELDRRI